jgi:ribonuclease Z
MTLVCTFYGTSAAVPSVKRGFSCIGLADSKTSEAPHILLDCGDGSIRNLLKFGATVEKISTVLITHFHSDHVTGLTQVIETMGIRKKKTNLLVLGPPGLGEYFTMIEKITSVASHREFQIQFQELSSAQSFKFEDFTATSFQMEHSIPCLGYRIVGSDGKVLAFTGDTIPCPDVIPLGAEADLFIHEATYLQKDHSIAREPKHSTVLEAAKDGRSAKAKKLVLTHVNDDVETEEEMIAEAIPEFGKNVTVARDGLKIEI